MPEPHPQPLSKRPPSRRSRWAALARLCAGAVLLLVALVGVAGLRNGRVEAATGFHASPLLSSPPPPLEAPVELRVVTFNVACGYLFTGNRHERLRAIAQVLRDLDPDLVGLQEAFIAEDRALLREALAGTRLAHDVRFPGATVGNGLWILSAHPIVESWFHRYRDGGRWYRLWQGDWWAGKGVGLARVALPGGGVVDFYDTHALAGRGNADDPAVRMRQMDELARFVAASRHGSGPAFVVGDLNALPTSAEYRHAVAEAGLQRMMSLDSRLDHIFAVSDAGYRFELLETVEIRGTTQAPRPELFLGRMPRPMELVRHYTGGPGETRLSDHPGYVSTIRVVPQ